MRSKKWNDAQNSIFYAKNIKVYAPSWKSIQQATKRQREAVDDVTHLVCM